MTLKVQFADKYFKLKENIRQLVSEETGQMSETQGLQGNCVVLYSLSAGDVHLYFYNIIRSNSVLASFSQYLNDVFSQRLCFVCVLKCRCIHEVRVWACMLACE